MGQSTATVLQSLLEGIPEDTFARPDIDGSSGVASHTSGLTPEDWQRALGAEEGIDKDELQALFHEFDADKSGRVSLAQFKAGLQTLQPRVGELDVLKGVLRNVDLNNMLAAIFCLKWKPSSKPFLQQFEESQLSMTVDMIFASRPDFFT